MNDNAIKLLNWVFQKSYCTSKRSPKWKRFFLVVFEYKFLLSRFRLIVDREDEVVVTKNYPAHFSSFVCDNETLNFKISLTYEWCYRLCYFFNCFVVYLSWINAASSFVKQMLYTTFFEQTHKKYSIFLLIK